MRESIYNLARASLEFYIRVLILTLNEVYKYRLKFIEVYIEHEAISILSLKITKFKAQE